jgi:alpha-D-xyloside xylohydrolase
MKFTDGFWVTKPGVQLFNCVQVQDARWEDEAYVVYCSHIPVADRGMTLNAPMVTLSFRAPRPGILSLTLSHFQGGARVKPKFELCEE